MRENNIRASPGYRTKKVSAGTPSAIVQNLLQRRFTVTRPNAAWVTDITYIGTWQGWIYLAAVMDLFWRKVIGWETSSSIDREVVLDAILMPCEPGGRDKALSTQTTQYGSDACTRFCESNHLEPSMSGRGNCWDNAVAESFFSSLKKGAYQKADLQDTRSGDEDLSNYIDEFYNPKRRHSHLGGVSPEEFEAALTEPCKRVR